MADGIFCPRSSECGRRGLGQHPALGGCRGTQELLAPPLAQLLPTHQGRTKVFTPLFLGELTVLGKLSGDGRKALDVVFKMLDKNSQQAFPLL